MSDRYLRDNHVLRQLFNNDLEHPPPPNRWKFLFCSIQTCSEWFLFCTCFQLFLYAGCQLFGGLVHHRLSVYTVFINCFVVLINVYSTNVFYIYSVVCNCCGFTPLLLTCFLSLCQVIYIFLTNCILFTSSRNCKCFIWSTPTELIDYWRLLKFF